MFSRSVSHFTSIIWTNHKHTAVKVYCSFFTKHLYSQLNKQHPCLHCSAKYQRDIPTKLSFHDSVDSFSSLWDKIDPRNLGLFAVVVTQLCPWANRWDECCAIEQVLLWHLNALVCLFGSSYNAFTHACAKSITAFDPYKVTWTTGWHLLFQSMMFLGT